MWRTSQGERILQGAEAALFRDGLGEVSFTVEADKQGAWSFGAAAFDNLQRDQQLAVLAQVGRGLLREEEPTPKLTAVTEATVAVIYAQVRLMVELEIVGGETSRWRQLVLDAFRASADEDDLPAADCPDLGAWDLLIECLADRILWDQDWKDGELYLDTDPECSHHLKEMMGIDEDYFVDVPPDPDDDELASVIETLRELTGGDEREFVTGIEDAYHDLLVGPCDEETAEREAGACRYVQEILVSDAVDFECSYSEWSKHLRGEVIRAPDAQRHHPPAYDVDAGEIKRAQDEGLADGTRIVPRADGWIVVDNDGFRLDDPDTCTWVAEEDEDDDREQPLVFPSPEDAYAAYMAAMAVAKACSRRREEALKRLAEAGGHVQQ